MSRARTFACGTAVLLLGSSVWAYGLSGAATPLDLERQLDLSVVAIDARIGSDPVRSSGVVTDADRGLVLTSARAVWGATSLRVGTALGLLHGRVVARAPCDDLALVQIQPLVPGLVTLPRSDDPPSAGDLLTSIGRRAADPDHATHNLLTIPTLVRPAPWLTRIVLDAPVLPEAAGGPVVDQQGRMVGITQSAGAPEPGPGAALAWAAIDRRLRMLRPGPRQVYVGWRTQYRCAAELHRATKTAHPAFRGRDARLNAPVAPTRLPGTEELDSG